MPGWNEAAWFALLAGVALKSSVVLGTAWLAAWLLRGRSAAARCLVWTAAAAGVLALPFLSASLPGLPVALAGKLLPDPGIVFHATATATAQTGTAHPHAAVSPGPRAAAQPDSWRPHWIVWLMLAWGAGALIALAQMAAACLGLRRVRRAAPASPDRDLAAELAGRLGIRRGVEILAIPAGAMPMTFGVLRPAIFLPLDASLWSEERRRIVLLHELAHVRRGDVATQLLARMAFILNWWNPLAWVAWREFLREREHATDDLVLQAGARASDYARHLLDVAAARISAPPLAWAAVAMARRSQLESRLAAILDARVRRQSAGWASALAAALAAVIVTAPLAAVRAPVKAPPIALSDVASGARGAAAHGNHEMPAPPEPAAAATGDRGIAYGVGLLKIADLERHRNRGQEAEAFYRKALGVLGDRPEAVPALMFLGIHRQDPAEAMDYLRRAERLDPRHAASARMWMALVREFQPDPSAAETLYKSALESANPKSAAAENILQLYARFLHKQGREEEAKQMRDRAISVKNSLVKEAMAQQPAKGVSVAAFRVGGDVKPPTLTGKVEPEYSEEARQSKYQGTVVVYAVIGTDGLAHDLRVIKGIGLGLDDKAIEAIERWRFRPGTRNGTPVNVMASIEVNFRLL